MKVEIIAVGNEVVYGHTVNTNASYIAQKVQALGMVPRNVVAVCDDESAIQQAVAIAMQRAEIIFITGGLGPTADDLTKEAICAFLGEELVIIPEELEKIKAYFKKMNRQMATINEKQAAFPKKAKILPNDCGTAPGCLFETRGHTIILLPGPPKEMKTMFTEYVLPYLKEKIDQVFINLDIRCFGIGESELASRIGHILGVYEWGSVATYVGDYEVIVRITAYGKTEKEIKQRITSVRKNVEECLEDFVIGYNDERLEENVVRLLIDKGYSISTVESCTGGLVAATLINCGGVSSCFNEGVVTYSNEAKRIYADVKEETLQRVGAVSEETAREMAEGIRRRAKTQVGLSTTGIAGPGGGTQEKPVGLVYIGIALPEGTEVFKLQLSGARQEVREKTVKNILFQLYKKLK